ncbi:MAG: hypothetical protein RLZZ275_340 [Bacteroidota bacterium]
MDIGNFTLKSQEILNRAQQEALTGNHPEISTLHLLHAMLHVEDPVVPGLLGRLNINTKALVAAVDRMVAGQASVAGASPGWSRGAVQVLQRAQGAARKAGDEYVASDRLSSRC